MAQNITIMGASYSDVPAVTLPKTGGGTASFDDTTDANATAAEIAQGKTAYVNGSKVVGSATSRTSSDLTVSGATVTAPAGYYASQASKTVASGSVTAPSSISGAGATLNFTPNPATFHMTKDVSITPNVTTAGYISAGTAGTSSVSLSAQATGLVNSTITPSTTDISIAANGAGAYWVTASAKVAGDADLIAGNIKKDVSIFGVTGTYEGSGATLQAKTNINPTTSSQTITPDTGYDGLSSVQINAMPNGSVTAPTSITGSTTSGEVGTIKRAGPTLPLLEITQNISVTPNVTTAGYVSSGTAGVSIVKAYAPLTGTIISTITPTTTDIPIASNGNGVYVATTAAKVAGDANLVAGNIKSGVSIFGVSGTYSPSLESITITPSSSDQSYGTTNNWTEAFRAFGEGQTSYSWTPSPTLSSQFSNGDTCYIAGTIYDYYSPDQIHIDEVFKYDGLTHEFTYLINGDTVLLGLNFSANSVICLRLSGSAITNLWVNFSIYNGIRGDGFSSVKVLGIEATNITGRTITPTTTTQTIASAAGLYNITAALNVAGDANLIPANIAQGVSIFGVTGTNSGNFKLLSSLSLGTISTTSTTATDTGKSITVTGVNAYDLLVCECSVDTITNGRHAATTRLIWLTGSSSDITTKNGATLATATLNIKVSASGVTTSRANTTPYGVYAYSCSLSDGSATISIYQRVNSTQTGTINGSYTMRVYGVKIYDLIGG